MRLQLTKGVIENRSKKGLKSFYIGPSEDLPLAEMTYVRSGELLVIIDHTFISDSLSGKGAGALLLQALIEWARKEGKKIIPLCPYAKAQMEKHVSYHDMIHTPR